MEDKELKQRFLDIFEAATPILEDLKKGFFTQQVGLIQECEKKFGDLLISRVPYVEKIIGEKEKSEADKKYVRLLPALQTIALAIENLMYKMEAKVAHNILFSEKALSRCVTCIASCRSSSATRRTTCTRRIRVFTRRSNSTWRKCSG